MKLHFYNYFLEFKHPFVLSVGSRTHTPVVYVELSEKGETGYGEAALPPYLHETQDSVAVFLRKLNLEAISAEMGIEAFHNYLEEAGTENHFAKAALDIAFHDLLGKIRKKNISELWGTNPGKAPYTTYTIGISEDVKLMKLKVNEGGPFHLFKVKLGSGDDKKYVQLLKQFTDKPFTVDVNQGWKDKYYASEMIAWLAEQGAILVEQPMPKTQLDDMAWVTERSVLPTIADESIQGLSDINRIKGAFSGINIKLMKCGGLMEGKQMAERAASFNMKILLGCMSESSCGVGAAAHLMSYSDWADLDGPFLIKNDPFQGIELKNGKIVVPKSPGIGVQKKG